MTNISINVILFKNKVLGTFLMVQWLRIHLAMQGTWVQFLVQENITCHRATKPQRAKPCAPHQEKPLQQEAGPLQQEAGPLQLPAQQQHRARAPGAGARAAKEKCFLKNEALCNDSNWIYIKTTKVNYLTICHL